MGPTQKIVLTILERLTKLATHQISQFRGQTKYLIVKVGFSVGLTQKTGGDKMRAFESIGNASKPAIPGTDRVFDSRTNTLPV